ncbi:MAG: methyltransferase [Leucobacter sp.]|nr:methyltransferase [Leucobacter sp.]
MKLSLLESLRGEIQRTNFTFDGVRSLLGEHADGARLRGVFAPAREVLSRRDDGGLTTLVRLFLLAETIDADLFDTTLPGLGATAALELGLVQADHSGGLRAQLSLNPVRLSDAISPGGVDWCIISDLDDHLRGGPARTDHVMGVGGATRSLIAQLSGRARSTCLDLGTGCGIVALHLALRGNVVATDVSARALQMAETNAVINGLADRIEFRAGSLFEPVAGEQFDLIASNPPFVITPRDAGGVPQYDYRDAGMVGDELAGQVVRGAMAHLTDGGEMVCLANWESPWGSDGLDRVGAWIAAAAPTPAAAWVIERDRLTPAQYAETWVRDGGVRATDDEFEVLMRAWLHDFAAREITSIGLGSIRVRRMAGGSAIPAANGAKLLVAEDPAAPAVRLEQVTTPMAESGFGDSLEAAFNAGVACQRLTDDQVLDTRWVCHDGVREIRTHRPGHESPMAITLVTEQPFHREVAADAVLAAAVGACDGELTLRQIADALATLLDVDAADCATALVEGARELTWLGMLTSHDDADTTA